MQRENEPESQMLVKLNTPDISSRPLPSLGLDCLHSFLILLSLLTSPMIEVTVVWKRSHKTMRVNNNGQKQFKGKPCSLRFKGVKGGGRDAAE